MNSNLLGIVLIVDFTDEKVQAVMNTCTNQYMNINFNFDIK